MLLHFLNSLAECDLLRTRTNREPSLRSGRYLSSHVSTDSCFAFSVRHFLHCVLRTVHVLGTVASSSTLVCSCTKFTENEVLMSRCCLSWCGVLSCPVLRIFCVAWVASPLVVAETSQVVVSHALGIFSFPIDLDCKPLLECSCIIPGDVENAMTAFSLTTRDIVKPIHLDAIPFIGTHSSLDEAVPRWALPLLALKRRIWQIFSMCCYTAAVCS